MLRAKLAHFAYALTLNNFQQTNSPEIFSQTSSILQIGSKNNFQAYNTIPNPKSASSI